MKRLAIIVLALVGCSTRAPEPVACLNNQTLEFVEGVRKYDFKLSDRTYIEYTDSNGFTRTINKNNADDWKCVDIRTLESQNATTVSQA